MFVPDAIVDLERPTNLPPSVCEERTGLAKVATLGPVWEIRCFVALAKSNGDLATVEAFTLLIYMYKLDESHDIKRYQDHIGGNRDLRITPVITLPPRRQDRQSP